MSKTPAEPNSTVVSVNGKATENYRVFPCNQPRWADWRKHDEEMIKLTMASPADQYHCERPVKKNSGVSGIFPNRFFRTVIFSGLRLQSAVNCWLSTANILGSRHRRLTNITGILSTERKKRVGKSHPSELQKSGSIIAVAEGPPEALDWLEPASPARPAG